MPSIDIINLNGQKQLFKKAILYDFNEIMSKVQYREDVKLRAGDEFLVELADICDVSDSYVIVGLIPSPRNLYPKRLPSGAWKIDIKNGNTVKWFGTQYNQPDLTMKYIDGKCIFQIIGVDPTQTFPYMIGSKPRMT